jgi:hypothetical protein
MRQFLGPASAIATVRWLGTVRPAVPKFTWSFWQGPSGHSEQHVYFYVGNLAACSSEGCGMRDPCVGTYSEDPVELNSRPAHQLTR